MATNRIWILLGAVLLVVGTGFFFLYASMEAEKTLRVQKENELSVKIAELSQTQTQLNTVTSQKSEMEQTLSTKIESLGARIKQYEEEIKNQSDELESLVADHKKVLKEKEGSDRKIAELSQKIQMLEKEKTALAETLAKMKAKKLKDEDDGGEEAEDAAYRAAASEPIELGAILLQRSSGKPATVQTINKLYGFIVINAGVKEGLRKDTVITISRDNKPIGKAVIEKVKPALSAAVILPEWTKKEIRPGDIVSM